MSTIEGDQQQDSLRIRLASPDEIRSWSSGEVIKPEMLNHTTQCPEKGGLFCEQIFGPEPYGECPCGQRFGHIELAAPVVHPWFRKPLGMSLVTLLGMKTGSLERILSFLEDVIIDPGETDLKEKQVLTRGEHREAQAKWGEAFESGTGAESIKRLLHRLDLVALSRSLRQELDMEEEKDCPSRLRLHQLVNRLKVIEGLRDSGNRPDWLVLDCIPVVPPGLRPLTPISGDGTASDLNDLYRLVLNHNNRLKTLVGLNAPTEIIREEKRLLQQAVDALFDNNRLRRRVRAPDNRPLVSLTDRIRDMRWQLPQRLLNKYVDYSGRSVVVPDPGLRLHQCGLPVQMALELFRPFLVRHLLERKWADSIESAQEIIDRKDRFVRTVLAEVSSCHPVLLSRAPTLSRKRIQAFEPVLTEEAIIGLHPLVCKDFDAGFNGEQVVVHLPLSVEAQVEAAVLMTPATNLLDPASGRLSITPTADIILGCYHLTATRGGSGHSAECDEGKAFAGPAEVLDAHAQGKLSIHARIRVRLPMNRRVLTEVEEGGRTRVEGLGDRPNAPLRNNRLVSTTVGRVVFNDVLHPRMPFYDLAMDGKHLEQVLTEAHRLLGNRETVELLDRIKDLGFQEATRSGLSLGIDDLKIPANKAKVLEEAEKRIARCHKQYNLGNITWHERLNHTCDIWTDARDQITRELMRGLEADTGPYLNPLYLMAQSQARGGVEQLRQLAGMIGLVTRARGSIIETPIRSNFREGLHGLEYFLSTISARRNRRSTVMRADEPIYLTRKLVEVAQSVVVTMQDCGTTQGVHKQAECRDWDIDRPLSEVITGRVAASSIQHPGTGEVIARQNDLITADVACRIEALGIDRMVVRSPMTCQAPRGVCQLCYGTDLSTGQLAAVGTAVGVLAAQTLGSPVGRFRKRTFHHFSESSLGRLTEILEARQPRNPAVLAEVSGVIHIGEKCRDKRLIYIQPVDEAGRFIGEDRGHAVPRGSCLRVYNNNRVHAGDPLVFGSPDPHEILRILGVEAVRNHLVGELQTVYRSQQVIIDDRHVEIIVAQMLRKVKVARAGDTGLIPGIIIDRVAFRAVNAPLMNCVKVREAGESPFTQGQIIRREEFEEECARLRGADKTVPTWIFPCATCSFQLLGITKAALKSGSFLSDAYHQAAVRRLTEAALVGQVDPLAGLRENAILGRLVPAGTGFRAYRSCRIGVP
jgi:DNA-directed RNA polymerase subunit beta'